MYYINYIFVESLTFTEDPVSCTRVSFERNQSDEQTVDGRPQFGIYFSETEEYQLQSTEQVFNFQLVNANINSHLTNLTVYFALFGCYLRFWAHLLIWEVNLQLSFVIYQQQSQMMSCPVNQYPSLTRVEAFSIIYSVSLHHVNHTNDKPPS